MEINFSFSYSVFKIFMMYYFYKVAGDKKGLSLPLMKAVDNVVEYT